MSDLRRDVLDLGGIVSTTKAVCVKKGLWEGKARVVRPKMESFHRAINVRVKIESSHQTLGATASNAKNDEIERTTHFVSVN
jgi:hypothetical protein